MDPASATSIAIKGGTMIATGSVIAEAVIFADASYIYLAIVGALVSMFGVAHEIYGTGHNEYSVKETVVELIKGVALGVLAIPFWYLIFTTTGAGLMLKYFGVETVQESFSSLSLIISFGMAWFTVPIFDFIAKTIPAMIGSYVGKFISRKGD